MDSPARATDREAIVTAAEAYLDAGLHPVPCDSDKRVIGKWKCVTDDGQTAPAFLASLAHADRNGKEVHGVSVVTRAGLLVIDVDQKYAPPEVCLLEELRDAVARTLPDFDLDTLPRARTRSGGWHLYLRYDGEAIGNLSLAQRPPTGYELIAGSSREATYVLVETRGHGGCAVAPPTPGYEMEAGDLAAIPELPRATVDALLEAARSMTRVPKAVRRDRDNRPRRRRGPVPYTRLGESPIEAYNAQHDALDLLLARHWNTVGRDSGGGAVDIQRPDKTGTGRSGQYSYATGNVYVFSTSTPLPTEKPLDAFAVYAYYEHGGDYSAAAKAVLASGIVRHRNLAATLKPRTFERPVEPENGTEEVAQEDRVGLVYDDDWGVWRAANDDNDDGNKSSGEIESEPVHPPHDDNDDAHNFPGEVAKGVTDSLATPSTEPPVTLGIPDPHAQAPPPSPEDTRPPLPDYMARLITELREMGKHDRANYYDRVCARGWGPPLDGA